MVLLKNFIVKKIFTPKSWSVKVKKIVGSGWDTLRGTRSMRRLIFPIQIDEVLLKNAPTSIGIECYIIAKSLYNLYIFIFSDRPGSLNIIVMIVIIRANLFYDF